MQNDLKLIIINSIYLQNHKNMLESELQISFSESKQQETLKTQQSSFKMQQNKENGSSIPIKVLKQSIGNQQRDRFTMKLQKEMQAKEDQLYQLTKNYRRTEQQLNKAQSSITKFTSQNESLKMKIKQLTKENQKQKVIQLQCESNKHNQLQLQELRNLQKQNAELHKKLTQLQKQHKVNTRRIQTQRQQMKKSLESKIQVKCKQQQKIEELFEKKKQDFNAVLEQKENQLKLLNQLTIVKENNLKQLNESLEQMTKKYQSLQEKLLKCQLKFKNDSAVWVQNGQLLKKQLSDMEKYHKEQISHLKNNLLSFYKDWHKDQRNLEISQIVQNVKIRVLEQLETKDIEIARLTQQSIQLQNLKQTQTQLKGNLSAQKLQIQKLNSLYMQAKTKVGLLEQQTKFLKSTQKNNTNFADIIRDHLKESKSKQEQQLPERKDRECVVKYKVDFKNTSYSEKQELTRVKNRQPNYAKNDLLVGRNQAVNMGRNKKIDYEKNEQRHFIGLEKVSPVKDQMLNRSQPARDNTKEEINNECSQYQIILSQLTHKKQSLIYLMYQGQNTIIKKPMSKQSMNKNQQSKSIKRRSNSMSELVRLRCESNTLNTND